MDDATGRATDDEPPSGAGRRAGPPPGDPPPASAYATTPTGPPLPLPAPPDEGALTPRAERWWALLAHLSEAFCIVIGPVLVLAAVGRRSAFVADQAREALNFQITMLAAILVGILLLAFGVGPWPLVIALFAGVGLAATAAGSAFQGELYRYPVALRLVR